MHQAFDFENLVELCRRTHEETQRSAARAVDRSLVVRNWLFGRYIVEYEQHGADRAEYGKRLIARLSDRLKSSGIKGGSPTNLWKFREFYHAYSEIPQTASVEFTEPTDNRLAQIPQTLSVELAKRLPLAWSHYVTLLTIDNPEERRFYELEAAGNGWSVRELERQINSSLYERLALSRDKEEVRRLASEGQVVEKASDLIKNPLVLEFLGLEEKPGYSESELETAIIDRLQHFLLELGKGFLFEARQKRFTFDNSHFRVDLVFYNRLLRCYVLIDLKRGELTHQDLGQMQMYVNYFDRYVKTDDERKLIGDDIRTAEFGWPVGMPLCRRMKSHEGLWEVRTGLPGNRIARVLFCNHEGEMILLHGFIKKSQKTPKADLQLAIKRMRGLK